MKNPDLLWEYQDLEQKRVQLQKQLKTMPEIPELRKLKEQIEKSQDLIRNHSKQREDVKHAIKKRELELSALTEKLNRAELELYGGNVQASRELEAAQKNILIIKEKIKVEEDEEFIELEKLEQTEVKIEPLLTELQEKKNLFRKINQEYTKKKEQILSETEKIQSRQEAISIKIDKDDWDGYQKLCEKYPDKSGIGILQEGVCSGCHMTVSFEQLKRSKHEKGIVCDNCGRWLIVK